MFNVRDIGSLQGAPVLGPDDEKVGSVGQVYVNPETEQPTWVSVKTGLFGKHETFVPLNNATWDNERLHIPVDKDTLKAAPRFDTDAPLTPDDEEKLYRFYDYHEQSDGQRAPAAKNASDASTGDADRAGSGMDGRDDDDQDRTDSRGSGPDASGADAGGGRHAAPGGSGVRLRKYVVTEYQSVTVPVTREEVRVEPESERDDARQERADHPAQNDRHGQRDGNEDPRRDAAQADAAARLRGETNGDDRGADAADQHRDSARGQGDNRPGQTGGPYGAGHL